jgi:O-antigen biosynthesis protein WbqP
VGAKKSLYTEWVKPLLDRVIGLLGLIALSWLLLLVALAIYIDDPGPVVFKQRRVGRKKNGELTYVNIFKFRTMKQNAPHDVPTHLLENPEQWVTRIGRLLRKSSLDELPQIWNIAVTHDISIVGPRPALWNQDDLVAEREKYGANDVIPGLTGWAQINGRDELEIPEKAKLDGYYAQNCSFALDIKCFFLTFLSVAKADGYLEGGTGSKESDDYITQ